MNLSSPVSTATTGLMEPPLSPGPPVTAPAQPTRSLEAEMVRMGLMTPDEVAATMREESETGRPFSELAVERGHVSAEHMAKIAKPVLPSVERNPRETQPAPPERRTPIFEQSIPARVEAPPAPVVAAEPAPVLAGEPAPVVEAAPVPIEAPPAPVVAAEPAPVLAAEPAPIVEAAPTPIIEPEPIVEPEPVLETVPVPTAETVPAPTLPVPTAETVPAPVIEPEPPVASEPPVAPPVQTAQVTAEVFVRLSNGERIAAGTFDGEVGAEQCAHELMSAVDTPGAWPRVDGRYVRPDAIVSIDVDLTGV